MQMKTLARLAVPGLMACALWFTGCGTTEADTTLSGSMEVPPVTTEASGTATAELDGNELTVSGSFSNLGSDLFEVAGSSAHVHNAPEGQSGPIVFNLEVTTSDNRNGTFKGKATLSDDEKDQFENGDFYVNVHTVNFNGGEIRGQFKP
ncbi:CHRD domain-containing protein [Myxococcus sp. RHSTA-1-4]|uniref:CHRD domain-containing protein n=1 Tax=Myxococcus sp. RHSTA-1-4 TaxID=2874601 RepID=UPI001CBD562B|nr:CHRD domain-containing protein [Myxococcus sp. RHSTA-1-4]MBZ4416594.1 CHRD domain-containing protein [Myxococcus sp. RHSTA-1-4]